MELSGGQKARVAFSDLFLQRPHVLILDEPTNHLDIQSVDALIRAINSFDGGVVCVTHDATLIDRTEMELWVCREGECWTFDDYRDGVRDQIEAEAAAETQRVEERWAQRLRAREAKTKKQAACDV